MRIKRTVIIPVILALSAAGSILAVPAVAAAAPAAQVSTAAHVVPNTHFWG